MTIGDYRRAIRMADSLEFQQIAETHVREAAETVRGAPDSSFGVCDEGVVVSDPTLHSAMVLMIEVSRTAESERSKKGVQHIMRASARIRDNIRRGTF